MILYPIGFSPILPYVSQLYPNFDNACGSGACSITSDHACLCSVALTETHVFDSLPSREDALSLKIGAFNPDTFSDADITYSLAGSSNGVEAYVSSDLGIIGATSTIFKVIDEYNEVVYLKNMKSDVTLGGLYELRNPPSFINLVKVELRDAEYEGMQKSPGVMLFKCTFVFFVHSHLLILFLSNKCAS